MMMVPWVKRHWNWKSVKSKGIIILGLILVTQLALSGAHRIHNSDINIPDRELNVDYFEPVFYEPKHLISNGGRAKREVGNYQPLKITLSSKSRDFQLHLEPDNAIFHPEVEIVNSEGSPLNYDTSRLVHGHLEDEPGSMAEGLITSEGHFDGVISTGNGREFHIEPSNRYLSQESGTYPGVVYERESVQWPSEPPSCASHLLHLQRTNSSTHINEDEVKNYQNYPHKTEAALNTSTVEHKRHKRYIIEPRRKTCMLYLQADHLFLRHLGSEEAAINMMARHIQRVNEIYRATDFDGDGQPDGISFMIKRIKVHTLNATLQPDYKYNGDFQVIKFLERFSEGDYESFCLAYMFTFRDFEGGTLGLAWTGDLKNAGGVCERKGHFRGGLKSLNTGIITLLNYGKVVLPAVSYVTLAHEIGHNFGSPHDPESERECVPGGRDGNFIMYARATAGDQKNNQRFSPCSLRSILPVLNAKARNIHGCFTEPQRGICGNREVEEGEECDCGWEEDCKEDCCWPMRLKYSKGEVPCTLRPKKECSPSQGPCCTNTCDLKTGDKCRDDNGCRHTAYCDGVMPACPPSVHKPNRTVCQEEQNVCFMGECTGSICLAYGLESCQCSPQAWDSTSKLCELCCKKPGEGQACVSSFELNDGPYDVPDLFAKPGSPCKNYTGYCDAYHTCREVDPSGPLATLRNLLLADEGLTAIAHWIDTHWYAVISFVALFVLMMVLTAKLCGKQAKKKLRAMTVLHSNVGAIQVERSYWDEGGQHVVHPAAVRKKIPLRKKIRDKKKSSKNRHKNRNATATSPLEQSSSSSNNIKAPRYGTLWRKRRADRSRLSIQKTDTANNSAVVEQSFDLVQMDTPKSSSSLYPELLNSTSPTTIVGTSPGAGTNNGNSSDAIVPGPSTSSPNTMNHIYEAKTAILPTAGRKKRSSRRPSSRSSHKKGVSSTGVKSPGVSKSKIQYPLEGPSTSQTQNSRSRRRPSDKSSSSLKTSSSEAKENKKPKKSIQIVYTPPFSVKVVSVDAPDSNANVPETTPSISEINTPGTSPAPNVLQNPISPQTVTPSSISSRPMLPIPEDEIPPPPYSPPAVESLPLPSTGENKDKRERKSPIIPSSSDVNGSGGGGRGHHSSSNSKKSKVKSSGSFLQRRKGRSGRNEKSELRILIPPRGGGGEDDGDITSPVTPSA